MIKAEQAREQSIKNYPQYDTIAESIFNKSKTSHNRKVCFTFDKFPNTLKNYLRELGYSVKVNRRGLILEVIITW